jgi:hypothetical protein
MREVTLQRFHGKLPNALPKVPFLTYSCSHICSHNFPITRHHCLMLKQTVKTKRKKIGVSDLSNLDQLIRLKTLS